jgi:hypothetical protein
MLNSLTNIRKNSSYQKQHLLEQQLNQQHLSFIHQNLSHHRNKSKLQEFAKQQVCTALTRNGELHYSQWLAQGLLAMASKVTHNGELGVTRSGELNHSQWLARVFAREASGFTRNGER